MLWFILRTHCWHFNFRKYLLARFMNVHINYKVCKSEILSFLSSNMSSNGSILLFQTLTGRLLAHLKCKGTASEREKLGLRFLNFWFGPYFTFCCFHPRSRSEIHAKIILFFKKWNLKIFYLEFGKKIFHTHVCK